MANLCQTSPSGMTEAFLRHIDRHGTRLVRVLSDLAVSSVEFSHKNLSEQLGQLIDFGDSMRLSALHDRLRTFHVEPTPSCSETLREDVLRVRMALVRSVIESFVPAAGSARVKVPTLKSGIPFEQLIEFEPYYRFYAFHQREFESKIQTLQLKIRDAVSGMSVELAQLAVLDEAVRDMLSMHIRKYLAVVPQLLGKRFDCLLQEYRQLQAEAGPEAAVEQPAEEILQAWTRPNGWLGRFLKDMQGVLLAELELRLLPVLGLVEAVHERAGRGR